MNSLLSLLDALQSSTLAHGAGKRRRPSQARVPLHTPAAG